MTKANAVVGQSGGPTGVINASLVGVIEEACKHPEIENLYGAVHAVAGIVKEEFIDLKKVAKDTLETVAVSPSSALTLTYIGRRTQPSFSEFSVLDENVFSH